MAKSKKYVMHKDSELAWLAVPRKEIFELGIRYKISEESRQTNSLRTVFLTHPKDTAIFVKAKGLKPASFFKNNVRVSLVKPYSRIRGMGFYKADMTP